MARLQLFLDKYEKTIKYVVVDHYRQTKKTRPMYCVSEGLMVVCGQKLVV